MFVVGMEVDVARLRRRARATLVISNAGIVVPFALGVLLSVYLYGDYAPPDVPFLTFALFTGIAMSITAFPVLARIIAERGLNGTELGNHRDRVRRDRRCDGVVPSRARACGRAGRRVRRRRSLPRARGGRGA